MRAAQSIGEPGERDEPPRAGVRPCIADSGTNADRVICTAGIAQQVNRLGLGGAGAVFDRQLGPSIAGRDADPAIVRALLAGCYVKSVDVIDRVLAAMAKTVPHRPLSWLTTATLWRKRVSRITAQKNKVRRNLRSAGLSQKALVGSRGGGKPCRYLGRSTNRYFASPGWACRRLAHISVLSMYRRQRRDLDEQFVGHLSTAAVQVTGGAVEIDGVPGYDGHGGATSGLARKCGGAVR